MEAPLLKSARDNFNSVVLMIIGVCLLIIPAIGFTIAGFNDTYPQISNISVGIFFTVASGVILFRLYKMVDIEIYSDRLVIKSYIGKHTDTILLSDITSYFEDIQDNGREKWVNLCIYTSDQSYLISEKHFRNYRQLKELLIKNKNRLSTPPTGLRHWIRNNTWIAGSAALALGLLSGYIAYISQLYENSKLDQGFSTFTGIALQKPYAHTGKGGASLTIWLKGHTQFECSVSEDLLSTTEQKSLSRSVKPGDSISIVVSKYDYLRKLTNQLPLSFWDKTLYYHHLKVYAVKYDGVAFGPENPKYANYNTALSPAIILFCPLSFILSIFGLAMLLGKIKSVLSPLPR